MDVAAAATDESSGSLPTAALGGIIGGGAAAVLAVSAAAIWLFRRRRAARQRKIKAARASQASWKPNRTGGNVLTAEAVRRLSTASLAAAPRGQSASFGRPVSAMYSNTINSVSPFFVQQQQRRQQPASPAVLAAGAAASSVVGAGVEVTAPGHVGQALNSRQRQLLAHMHQEYGAGASAVMAAGKSAPGPAPADVWSEKAAAMPERINPMQQRQLQVYEVSRLKLAREKHEFAPRLPVVRGRGAGDDRQSTSKAQAPSRSSGRRLSAARWH